MSLQVSSLKFIWKIFFKFYTTDVIPNSTFGIRKFILHVYYYSILYGQMWNTDITTWPDIIHVRFIGLFWWFWIVLNRIVVDETKSCRKIVGRLLENVIHKGLVNYFVARFKMLNIFISLVDRFHFASTGRKRSRTLNALQLKMASGKR